MSTVFSVLLGCYSYSALKFQAQEWSGQVCKRSTEHYIICVPNCLNIVTITIYTTLLLFIVTTDTSQNILVLYGVLV